VRSPDDELRRIALDAVRWLVDIRTADGAHHPPISPT
jgi:hypothetical protein